MQDTLLEDIDRIEIIRGPGGTIWGPNAVNGVINIITKSSRDTKGLFASAGGGNVEQGFANFRFGGGNDDGLTWRVYGKGFTRGPEYHYDANHFDAWRGGQGGFRMDWKRSLRNSFTLQGDLCKQEDGEQLPLTTYVPPATYTVNGYEQVSGGNLLFRWTRTLSEKSDFQLQVYYDRTSRDRLNLRDHLNTFDLDLQARRKFSRQQILYGVEGRGMPGQASELTTGAVFTPANRKDYLVSGFLEDDITLVEDRLVLSLGTKILRTNYTGVEAEPSARLMWTPNAGQAFWAAFSRAIGAPSDAEEDLYASTYLTTSRGIPVFARLDANRAFTPEKLNGYEIGYRQLVAKNVYLGFAGFFNHYHDLFSEDVAGSLFLENTLPFPSGGSPQPPVHYIVPVEYRNSLYGNTQGGEVAPEWRPTSYWRLRASYSFLNMNLSAVPGSRPVGAGTPASVVGSSPKHQVTAQSSFDIAKRVQFDLIYRYVSALPALAIPSYSTADARFAWQFRSGLEFSVAARNLLQPRHVEYFSQNDGTAAIERSVYATLSWRSK